MSILHTLERQIDQIRRRVVFGERIPHDQKVFSIFEPHIEWIIKGKAGVSQELGLRVCVLRDQHGFILHHLIMERQTDDKVVLAIARGAKDRFDNLTVCSFDKGFYSAYNREELSKILDHVILPKKPRRSAEDKSIEQSDEFVEYRRKHSSVESSINVLENHGLDRCLDHGPEGFKRYKVISAEVFLKIEQRQLLSYFYLLCNNWGQR
ncbi:MAG: transposase [Deltaproteobacteria bacterium]|nr:transposase [Deltaproteobacteria bacterium]